MILTSVALCCIVSFFVTFILSEGLIRPNSFLNDFFKFWPGYLLIIPTIGAIWGIVLSTLTVYFRDYLAPRILLLKRTYLRLIVITLSSFTLGFLGLLTVNYACILTMNFYMWSRVWTLSVASISGIFGIVFGFLLYAAYQNKALLRQAEIRERELVRHRLEGDLMNLNLRIRPHFFFNALNILASLIDKDRAAAQEFLADLADLFRKSFSHGQERPLCSWIEEKEILQAYLVVEKMRFMDRLEWRLEVDAPDDAPFPAFLLQPLVENAVHHGIAPSHSTQLLVIKGHYDKGAWRIRITNSLSTPARVVVEKGHALWTIRQRLKLMRGTLTLEASDAEFSALLVWHDPDRGENTAGPITAA